MSKMRILIAARGDRRSALARALGVHYAHPRVEVGAADTREMLFKTLASGTWHGLVIGRAFDGAPAEEVIQAATELTRSTAVFVLDDGPAALEALATRLLELGEGRAPACGARLKGELPVCSTLDELLELDGRKPRSGLLSAVMIRSGPTDAERIVRDSLQGGAACRWHTNDILVLRRAASAGEALVWAESVYGAMAGSSLGVTWFRAGDLQDSSINQAERALHLAETRSSGVASWATVVALHHAARIAGTIDQPEARRLRLLQDLPLGPEQRQHLTHHSEEVADAAVNLANLLRLGPEACDRIRLAGLLHDLGKITIPDDLLAKPGPLSPEEKRVLNRHSAEGAWLCDALGMEPEIGRIVRHHHTRFDALEVAPDAARVVSVADAMVTMTSARPYSAAKSFEFALSELRRCRGTVFDPRVVIAAHILGASNMSAAA